ncbi:hypothetical protein C4552_00015 [Candidatus Parcubacteria bacterium]|nr:MAG: hypothetical protein C4552_00015 [Candidatus Parcubacteria bacterium]
MMQRIVILGSSAVLAVGGYWFIARSGDESPASAEFSAALTLPWAAVGDTASNASAHDAIRYAHPRYGFSFEYPDTLRMETFSEVTGGETILFQNDAASGPKRGFQIAIHPFEGGEVLTRERIMQDTGMAVEEPREVIIGTNQPALIFWSNDARIGRTREVWMIHGRYVYAITTYAELDAWLAEILATWRFGG